MVTFGDENIGGLNVAVHDSFGVRGIEGIRDLDCQCKQSLVVDSRTATNVLQCRALEKLHRNECLAFFGADIINRANVGMIQGGRCSCLALKPRERLRVEAELRREEFESYRALKARVERLVDNTHPSIADFL